MTKLAPWIRELRPHQWTKNLLLGVPAIASFTIFVPDVATQLVLAFISFSLIASASYIFNDLVDLKNDRIHEIKRKRPLASGQISIPVAVTSSSLLLLTGLHKIKKLGNHSLFLKSFSVINDSRSLTI
jgi:4-hydroxybenzoate polyprenyltransferase